MAASSRDIKAWMSENVETFRSGRTGEINCTWMAEAADEKFEIAAGPRYDIPEWVFDLAFEVAEEYEK